MQHTARARKFRALVSEERKRQEAKWGTAHDDLPMVHYIVALMEEVGELAHARIEDDIPGIACELVQVAAVCQRIYETFNYLSADQ